MIFLRHPRPKVAAGICYGRLDVPLRPGAAAEIAGTLKTLPKVSRVISSPAQRCRRLADAIGRFHGVEVEADPRLWELNFGAWEGQRWDMIDRGESDPWAADPMHVAPPGGETFAKLLARVEAALKNIPPDAAVVTHAGVIRAAKMLLTGAAFEAVFAERIPYARSLYLMRESA
ncbi:MAG: alpha-ribazole phosphatase family protein [Pseudomonadota bacterium]